VGGGPCEWGREWMKEMKVTIYGRWTSYIYMKQNKETYCNCFKWGSEGSEAERWWGQYNNVQHKSNQNCHYESSPYNEYILIKKLFKKKIIPAKVKVIICKVLIFILEISLSSQSLLPIFIATLHISILYALTIKSKKEETETEKLTVRNVKWQIHHDLQ
jgi:hypothetical protein